MIQVRSKYSPELWGYVTGEGTLTVQSPACEHKIVRVAWANDAVCDVPSSLQYADDLEIIE